MIHLYYFNVFVGISIILTVSVVVTIVFVITVNITVYGLFNTSLNIIDT